MYSWFLTAISAVTLVLFPISDDNHFVNDKSFQEYEQELIHNQEEIACLAVNIYHEARGESEEGKLAVAFVTLNRVKSDAYPDTVCGVVYQGKHKRSWRDNETLVPVRHGCQFSWYCDGKSDMVQDFDSYEEIVELSMNVWYGRFEDNTDGSLFYHADYVDPAWAQHMAMTKRIDNHIFYTMSSY